MNLLNSLTANLNFVGCRYPRARLLAATLLGLAALAGPLGAVPTENFGLRLLSAPKDIKIDGETGDWNLAAGVFASNDPEIQHNDLSVWLHGAYDADNLYLLARFLDSSPTNNPGDTRVNFGWSGDCLQIRVITDYGTPAERLNNLTCWRGSNGVDVVELAAPGVKKNSPAGENIKLTGARQAFKIDADGKGYTQEIAIPWKLLTAGGHTPTAGESVVITAEPNFTFGDTAKRVSVKDIFRPGVPLDRVFTFSATKTWGVARLLPADEAVEPQPVRLSDGRTFPVSMQNNAPVIDWTGLVQKRELEGFAPITFTLATDGYVSLHIKNSAGEVVRQLLNAEPLKAGEHTVKWDGLTTPEWRTPGEPVPAGAYTWSAITHPGIGVKLRGFASSGARVPWDDGRGSNWGGDMGNPCAVATDGDHILLGWGMAEAGKAAVLTDLDGKPIWGHKRGGIGGARFVALDQGVAYIIDPSSYGNPLGAYLYKLSVVGAAVVPFTATGAGELTFRQIAGGEPGLPNVPDGMAVKGGRLYLSTSSYAFAATDITDWRAFLTKVSAGENPLWTRLPESVRTRTVAWLKSNDSEDKGLARRSNTPDVRSAVVKLLNELIKDPALTGNPAAAKRTGDLLVANNRTWIEQQFPAITPRVTGFVAIIDAASGTLDKRVSLPGAGTLLATDATGVYVLVNGESLVFVEAATGNIKTIVADMDGAKAVARDATGNFYVGLAAPQNYIQVYSPTGKKLRIIGREGGRPEIGPWQAEAFRNIAAMSVDSRGQLWVGENISTPRRFSAWNAETGKLAREYFGPTHYGAGGGAILPSDPNVMVGEGTEWRIDPQTGRATAIGVYDTRDYFFSRFATGSNGHVYLAGILQASLNDPVAEPGRIVILERLRAGDYRLRATLKSWPGTVRPKTAGRSEFWADKNDDQQEQPDEIQTLDKGLILGGYYFWSMNLATDLTFTGGTETANRSTEALQIKVGGFTACGAPVYDVAHIKALPAAIGAGLPSLDGRLLLADGSPLRMIDSASGKVLWSYPNLWSGVHGSHRAPQSEPGLFRGVFGIVGTARLPAPVGDIWAFNSNVGEWHLMTGDGFYLSRLFQPDWLSYKFPKVAEPGADITGAPAGMGGEDFGGSMVQGTDGKVYVQAGKTALWNAEVTGLDQVKALPGGALTISADDVKKAAALHDAQLQAALGGGSLEIKRFTPTFTGNLDVDFKDAQIVTFKKTEDSAARAVLTWDDTYLYAAWEVRDPTPWLNNAERAEYMYARGDTVDLQLGLNPKPDAKRGDGGEGDLRLSIGSLGGKATAVIYRKVSKEKAPMTFSSGVIADYVMDNVRVAPEVRIEVKKEKMRYVVEAAIPLKSLGAAPAAGLVIHGDLGVTYSDQAGMDTRLRSYWSNQATGLVDDEVFELKMDPKNWGEMKFAP